MQGRELRRGYGWPAFSLGLVLSAACVNSSTTGTPPSRGGAGAGGISTATLGGSTGGTQAAGSGGIVGTGGAPGTGGSTIATTTSGRGGAPGTGGVTAGGTLGTGGTAAGGTSSTPPASGGAPGTGGGTSTTTPGRGGATGSGGSTGSGGMLGNGGRTGGASGTGGGAGGGTVCPLPATIRWTSSGPLAKVPRTIGGQSFVSLKDFTSIVWNGKHVVYMTTYEPATQWNSALFVFTDWSEWDATPGTWWSRDAIAPALLYFTPKKTWVLHYQWGLQYATSDDPTDPAKWSAGKTLLSGGPTTALDPAVICDSASCYLFYAGDDGKVYRSSMPIGSYPGTFSGYQTILTDTTANLFEGPEIYSIKGANLYLLLVEAVGGGGRFYRAFTSPTLDGTFTPLPGAATEATPFAGKKNVTFDGGNAWTNDISHGDMVRGDPSETKTIDPCNLQFLYQGYDKSKSSTEYGTIPYQPGLLTLQR